MPRLSSILARILSRGHALDLIESIQLGEFGCVTCGWRGPKGDAIPAKHSRVGKCPACGLDLYDNGFCDGDDFAEAEQAA